MPTGAKGSEAFCKLLKGETVSGPAKLFLGLAEEAQTPNVTSSTIKGELTYEGYGRVEINLAEEEIVAATESAAAKLLNKLAIVLKNNTNTTGKAKAKAWFLADVASGVGGVWVYGTLTEVVEIIKAMTEVKVPAKELSIGIE